MQVIPAGLRANSSAVLAVLLWSLAISGLSAARYSFDHYSQEQGLGNSLVRAIQQDRAGFLWVATKAGLYRFDGVRFQLFSPFDGSTPETIRDVHVDRAGTLWVVTNQTLAKLVGQRFQTVPLGSGGGARFSLASDSKGSIYVATPKGLLVWKGQGEVTALGPAGLTAEGPVHGVWVGSDDVLWYGCGQAICRWDGTEARVYGTTDGVPAANWGSFARDKSGNLWARGGDRLAMQRQGESQFRPDRNFSHPGTGRILVDGRGRLVVPAEDGIWMRAESGQWEQIHEEEGLPSNRVNCVFEDREGSLWIGFADLGLARWRGNGDWKGFTRQDGLSSSEITGIASNKDGTLWVGSRKGLNRRDPLTGAWRLLTSRDGLSADDVRALAVTPNGYVWVASREHGLARLDPRTLRAEPAHTAQCRTLCQIISLTVDDTGTLWVATRQGVFSSRQIETGSAEFQPAFSAQLLPGEQVYRVRRDTHGRMWLAGTRGLHFEGPAGWTRLTASDGLLSNTVTFLTVNEDDSAWVGYGEFLGVSRLRWVDGELKIDHYNKDNRLFSNDICFLETGPGGSVWIGTDSGVDVFDGRWRHFGTGDGLLWPDTVFNAFHLDGGNVWIGTNRGLSWYQPSGQTMQPEPPGVALTGIRFAGQEVNREHALEIPHERRMLEVGFSTFSFARTHATRFRYRLLGFAPGWVETASRTAVFPNLPGGSYQLEVQAGTQGVWNPNSASFAFRILAPWWETWWFRSSLLAAFSLLCWRVLRRRTVRARQQRADLESAVAERTAELARERDRTQQEKRKVEEQKGEIERLLAESQEANRLKSEFLANVSHEIRTPMNGILGMTTLALETPLEPEQRECVEAAKHSAEALLSLLNDILDFSRIEANRLEMEAIPFVLASCVDDSIRTLSLPAQQKGLSLEKEISPDVPLLLIGDPTRLRQVLLNLISNSIKFTAAGHVRVRVETMLNTGSTVSLRFRVTDSGMGIPLEKQKVIFEAFRQADGSTTRKHGGTGLGLAICSRLVALMGGSIAVRSEPGQGSEFSFTARFHVAAMIPVHNNEAAPELRRLAGAVTGGGRKCLRVLVAEDNLVNQKVLVRLLEKQGHEADIAVHGRQALDMTSRRYYDLVLMDVQMPEMDGLETTRLIRIREAGGNTRLPILILTANAMAGDREKCLDAGADGYLSKPVSLDRLMAAIEEVTVEAKPR